MEKEARATAHAALFPQLAQQVHARRTLAYGSDDCESSYCSCSECCSYSECGSCRVCGGYSSCSCSEYGDSNESDCHEDDEPRACHEGDEPRACHEDDEPRACHEGERPLSVWYEWMWV